MVTKKTSLLIILFGSEITRIMVDQMNRWILVPSGSIGSFDLPWSGWSQITDSDPDHPKGTNPSSITVVQSTVGRQQHLNCSRIASAHFVYTNFCHFDFQLRFPGQILIRSYCNWFLLKTSVITFYSKGDTVIFLISTLILLRNVFVTQFINYRILSRTVFELLFIAAATYSFPRSICPNIKVTSRESRQTPFTLTTKNVLQFTLRRRTVDLAKKNVKGKFQTFLKGMICFHTGRWQHSCFLFWLCCKRN